jgi:adenylate cyclase
MVFGALLFAYAVQRLEAVPALILFMAVFFGFGVADFKVLFEQNISLNSTFFYLELFTIFFVILAAKYVIEERSKKFVRSAFAKYVAPAVVDSILKDPEKLQVGGLKKDLTIMFSDIRSFTTFSEKMDAPKLAHFLNDYLGIMTKIVFANEGTLDKYIGDAIMAFWGAPLDQPQHAANACKAAMAMMKALHENKERWLKDFNVDVNIGVGINSGPVNVGNMGSTDNFSYTVIGDHVNLSSRLEGLTKEYGVSILTTRFTFDEITKANGDVPPHRVLDNTKVKGKKNAVELIQVLDRPMQKEGLEMFAEGRKLYLAQEWDQAIAKFREANSILAVSVEKPDGPSHLFIERCVEFKKNPPGKDWDGSWEMHHK